MVIIRKKVKMRNAVSYGVVQQSFFEKRLFVERSIETEEVTINEHGKELYNQSIMDSKSWGKCMWGQTRRMMSVGQ